MFARKTIKGFLKELASKKPTPGGGSAAALAGAISAGLLSMAAKFSGDENVAEKSERLMMFLTELIDKDAQAFERVIREKSSQDSLEEATEIPLQTARRINEVMELAEDFCGRCSPKVKSDFNIAMVMAEAAFKCAMINVNVNLDLIKDEGFKKRCWV